MAFKFIATTTAFSVAGQIHYSNGIISINTDSDAATEYEIQLTGVIPTTLAATDFVLKAIEKHLAFKETEPYTLHTGGNMWNSDMEPI